MDYIDLLAQEEKSTLCGIIAGREFKELFKRNEQEFTKIRKGFRAKSLTEQSALSIAIANVDKPFIAMWVNTRVDIWLKEIQENIEKLEGEGSIHDIALAATMLDSVFANHVDLYLKLVGKSLEVDACPKLHGRDEIIRAAISASTELQEKTKALIRTDWEAENKSLLAEAQKELDSLGAELRSVSADLSEAQEAFMKTKSEEEQLAGVIAEKKRLAEDVEAAVAERIQKARENAADFIADMAFVGGRPIHAVGTEAPVAAEVSSKPVITPYRTFAAYEDRNDLEAHHSWEDVVSTAAFELGEAGVA